MKLRPEHYYKTCSEIPVYNFFTIAESGDFTKLLRPEVVKKSNRFKQDDLKKAWDSLNSEYIELTAEGGQAVVMLINIKNMAMSYNELLIVGGLVKVLNMGHNDAAAEQLKAMGYKYNHDPLNPEVAQKSLNTAVAKLKALARRVENLQQEHKKEVEKAGKDKTPGYEQTLTDLSRFQGYRLDKYTVTVTEYVSLIKQCNAEAKRNNKKS